MLQLSPAVGDTDRHRVVVGLGAARDEHHLTGARGSYQPHHPASGALHRRGTGASVRVAG